MEEDIKKNMKNDMKNDMEKNMENPREKEMKWRRIQLKQTKPDVSAGQEVRKNADLYGTSDHPSSSYLIARMEDTEEYQKELLYRILGPIFFGEKAAGNLNELITLFRERYGIDVLEDFCEGDEHYEEYQEAQQAIAEGLGIYGGAIPFEDCGVAELAEQVWEGMEKENKNKGRFRRINTMLEE